MNVTVLLADSAQSDPSGKVHALGLGWSTTVTPTPPAALIVFIKVGWNETNKRFALRFELVDSDGRAVTVPGPLGDQPIVIEGEGEAGRPPGLPVGTPVDLNVTTSIGPGLNLVVGQRYEWRVSVDGKAHADWTAGFTVMGAQGAQ